MPVAGEDSKRSGRWRLSMQILTAEAATRSPSLTFFLLSFFCLSQLSSRLTSRTDVSLRRTVDSCYHLVGIFYIWRRKNWSWLPVLVYITLLNLTRNIIALVDSIVKEVSRRWFTTYASPFCFPDKNCEKNAREFLFGLTDRRRLALSA